MRALGWIVKGMLGLLLVAVVAGLAWVWIAPPDLFRVATGYSAKIVCSNAYLAGRDPATVLADDVQSPGHPLLRWVSARFDDRRQSVTTRLFWLLAPGGAVHRSGLGCASVPDGNLAAAAAVPRLSVPGAGQADGLWPRGERVEPSQNAALATVLDDASLQGPGMRAIVVVHGGRIVGERYGPGLDAATPLLGWS